MKNKPTKRAKPWLEPEGLTLIEGWVRDGLTDEDISKNMGIAYSTFRVWRDKYSALSAVLKDSKEVADYKVENALYNAALSGNITAMIFWLKNRRADKWRDVQQIEQDLDMNLTVSIDYGDEDGED